MLDLTIGHGQLPELSKQLTELIVTSDLFLDKAFGRACEEVAEAGGGSLSLTSGICQKGDDETKTVDYCLTSRMKLTTYLE